MLYCQFQKGLIVILFGGSKQHNSLSRVVCGMVDQQPCYSERMNVVCDTFIKDLIHFESFNPHLTVIRPSLCQQLLKKITLVL